MTDAKRSLWTATGEVVANDERITADRLQRVLNRVGPALRGYADVALGMPVYRDVELKSVIALAELVHFGGLQPLLYSNFEVAACREWIVDRAIQLGFRRLLFLDSDTVCDMAGFERMNQTMDRHDVALVGALVRRRDSSGASSTNAFLGKTGDMRPVEDSDIPTTLVPFPVHYVGLACALLDLTKISKKEGPRFQRRAEGYNHMSENWLFCRWLEANDLDFLVDPGVATSHEVVTSFTYVPAPKSPDAV